MFVLSEDIRTITEEQVPISHLQSSIPSPLGWSLGTGRNVFVASEIIPSLWQWTSAGEVILAALCDHILEQKATQHLAAKAIVAVVS